MSQTLSSTARELGSDARDAATAAVDRVSELASRGADAVRENVVDPARRLGHRAAEAVQDTLGDARDVSKRQLDRACGWVSDNPLTAVGLGVGIGILVGLFSRR